MAAYLAGGCLISIAIAMYLVHQWRVERDAERAATSTKTAAQL